MDELSKRWRELGISDAARSPAQRIDALIAWLTISIRTELPLPLETMISELDAVWENFVTQLSAAFSTSALPYNGAALAAWDKTRQLLELRLALISRQFGPPPPPPRFSFFRKQLPPKKYSTVAALSTLRLAYLAYVTAYRLPPKGFWLLAHQLFMLTLGLPTNGEILKLPKSLPPGVETYRQLVVYALANPYSLRSGYLVTSTQLLDYFAPLTRLLDAAPAQEGARGLVVIALDTDQLPRSIARADPSYFGTAYLFLQLHDLTYEFQQCAENIARGASLPVKLAGEVDITRRETVEIISSALRAFAGIAARAVPRVPASGAVEVVSGFYSAWTVLTAAGENDHNELIDKGNVVNQTITGVAFQLDRNAKIQIRVGEIVLFRRPGQPLWRVGVVRWIEVDAHTEILLAGCQALGLRSDAYTATDPTGLDVPIIVAQVPNHVGDTTVLVPDHGAGSDIQLTTHDGETSATILLTDLRETHANCVRYQFLTL
jgi:hypothetical protein